MSTRAPTNVSRFYPTILVVSGVAVAVGCKLCYDYYTERQREQARGLSRRGAQRRRHRHQNYNNATSATAETLAVLDGTNVRSTTPEAGISLPQDEALTTMLNNAGAAARDNREEVNDSELSYDRGDMFQPIENQENQNVLHLLYLIAEDQAKQQGYVHRGVTCNVCNTMPIRGIRYRCSNCIDFDLCESCEAQDMHPKTHLFYKVRIPAPFLGNPKKIQAPVYPGRPNMMPPHLPSDVSKQLHKETSIDQAEIEALYEQFRCLAATEYPGDKNNLNGAIDRKTFDKCFVPNNSLRPPPPNLIYDRMFVYYDTDNNGLIDFEEFIHGIAIKTKRESHTTANAIAKHKRTFKAYDLDDDGYIERKDVLRMFRAFYALQKDLVKDLIAGLDDDVFESQSSNVVMGSAPISQAFAGMIPGSEGNRRGKTVEEEDNDVVVRPMVWNGDERGRRAETLDRAYREHQDEIAEEAEKRRRERERERRAREDAQEQRLSQPSTPRSDGRLGLVRQMSAVISQGLGDQDPSQSAPLRNDLLAGIDFDLLEPGSEVDLQDQLQMPNSSPLPESYANIELPHGVGYRGGSGNQRREEPPGRRPTAEEAKLYYLDDESSSSSSHSDDEGSPEPVQVRKRYFAKGGLEREEDVGREILNQTVEHGINQLLDMLFLAKEKDGLAVLKHDHNVVVDSLAVSEDIPTATDETFPPAVDSTDDSTTPDPPLSPTQDPMEELRRDLAVRGGPGRITLDEFLSVMSGDAGRKLVFMSTWINMGSF